MTADTLYLLFCISLSFFSFISFFQINNLYSNAYAVIPNLLKTWRAIADYPLALQFIYIYRHDNYLSKILKLVIDSLVIIQRALFLFNTFSKNGLVFFLI
jgi:hypothetical protein